MGRRDDAKTLAQMDRDSRLHHVCEHSLDDRGYRAAAGRVAIPSELGDHGISAEGAVTQGQRVFTIGVIVGTMVSFCLILVATAFGAWC